MHRDILQRHLRRLSFLDLESGGGSALTSKVGLDGASTLFDITFKASLLDESLTNFLNTKEARLFSDDGSGFSVEFYAGPADALTYVLLHEATHIVDQVLRLTDEAAGPFMASVWVDVRALSQPHADSLAASHHFEDSRVYRCAMRRLTMNRFAKVRLFRSMRPLQRARMSQSYWHGNDWRRASISL